jgi:hypothetical protein
MFVYSAAGCYKESPNCVAAVAVKLLPEDLKLGERQSCFTHLAKVLVWDSPRREGVLPAGDIWGNWNVTLVPTDV